VSNTSNFSFCVELSIGAVREIFHLAFKNEPQCFPHNVGPFTRSLDGLNATITVAILDDDSRPADLTFVDEKHILFSFPNDITVEIPDAPDPALSRIVLSSVAKVPGRLDSWDDAGEPVVGIRFDDVDPSDVTVEALTGLPSIGAEQLINAIHSKYDTLPHRYTATAPGGTAELLMYDGVRDPLLIPPAPSNPPISATLEAHAVTEYLNVVIPIHVDIPTGVGGYHYISFGRVKFWRPVTRTQTTITAAMSTEPGDAALRTMVELDSTAPGQAEVAAQLQPLAVSAISAFGSLSAPAYSSNAATNHIAAEIASYVDTLRFGLWTPRSTEEGVVPSTPVGFLLVDTGTLAILVTVESGTEGDAMAPDDFRGSHDVSLAVSRQFIVTRSDQVIQAAFPGVNGGGGYEFHRDQGDATLYTCHAAPEDDGDHRKSPGHLWVTGEAEVHIDCWPDPDVSFSGPVFIDSTRRDDLTAGCYLELQPRAGEFDVGESCCDVLLDILIPVVGWIVLAVVEHLIDEIGGQIATETAGAQTQLLDPLPKVVIGVAQIACCLETLVISSQGFVFPGTLSIRRDGRSFEDLVGSNATPRPDRP
jgi:hypothetical protein